MPYTISRSVVYGSVLAAGAALAHPGAALAQFKSTVPLVVAPTTVTDSKAG